MSKKCFATTNGFWVSPQGYVYPCAKIKHPYKKIHISDIDDYSKINQNFLDIKESLSKNIWHSACERCEFDENNKITRAHDRKQEVKRLTLFGTTLHEL